MFTSAQPGPAGLPHALMLHTDSTFVLQVLSGFLAGVAALSVAGSASATATPVDIIDDRKVIAKGFNIIYEARDLALSQSERDGLSQPRASLEDTRARVKLSEDRLDKELEPYISKAYW